MAKAIIAYGKRESLMDRNLRAPCRSWVIHVIPAIPTHPVRPKSGRKCLRLYS